MATTSPFAARVRPIRYADGALTHRLDVSVEHGDLQLHHTIEGDGALGDISTIVVPAAMRPALIQLLVLLGPDDALDALDALHGLLARTSHERAEGRRP